MKTVSPGPEGCTTVDLEAGPRLESTPVEQPDPDAGSDLSAIFDGVLFLDRDGVVTRLNAAAEELLEIRAIASLGRRLGDLSGGELLAALLADVRALAAAPESEESARAANRIVEVRRDFGPGLLFVRVRLRPTRDANGGIAGAMALLRDVTVEHKSDDRKNRYLSIVAHELRTPLTGIKTFTTMLGKGSLGPLSAPQANVLDAVREQVLRLEHQIDKLVHLGDLDSDDFAQDLDRFDLGELVQTSTRAFARAAADREIELSVEQPDFPAEVRADRAQLRRALQALVENAVKFCRDGGKVSVILQAREKNTFEVSVSDEGVGVDPRYHARIFEKFFQVEDPLTRHHGGSGLGLYFVQRIVRAHRSRVEVVSEIGRGARFSFTLPGAEEDEPEPNSPESEACA